MYVGQGRKLAIMPASYPFKSHLTHLSTITLITKHYRNTFNGKAMFADKYFNGCLA